MKTLVFALALLLFALSGCYVSQVSIKLDSENASDLKCTVIAPTDNSRGGLDSKLKSIQTKAKAKGILFYFNKQRSDAVVNGRPKTTFIYQIQAKLSTPTKAEKLSAIITEEMKITPDDFWYKVYAIEDSETEKVWQIDFAFKPKARGKGEPQDFKFTVAMPQNVVAFSPNKNTATFAATKQGKQVVFSYAKMEIEKLYEFNVKAVKEKPVPVQAAPAIVTVHTPSTPPAVKDTMVTVSPTVIVSTEESKPFMFGLSVAEFTALVTMVLTVLTALFNAIGNPFKKKEDVQS